MALYSACHFQQVYKKVARPDKIPITRAVWLSAALPTKPKVKVIAVPIMLGLLWAAALVKCCICVGIGLFRGYCLPSRPRVV